MRSLSAASEGKASRPRVIAIDAFRGLTIFLMLLVNNFGVEWYTPKHLTHAGWSGEVHLADLVFPWFLFCVGVSVPFSAAGFKAKQLPAWHYDVKVLRRTAVLIALGVLVNSVCDGRFVVRLGVLQTIGLAYAVGALLYDLPRTRRLLIAALALVGYWGAIKYLPIPGVGSGVFEEGVNIVNHINVRYLAPVGFQGLPLILPTSALVLIGTVIGDIIRAQKIERLSKSVQMILIGIVLTIAGDLWSLSISFVKPLWTPSYIVLTAGTGCIALGALYWLIDEKGLKRWAFPFIVFGSNAILAYVLPILVKALVLHPLGLKTGGWIRVSIFIIAWWIILLLFYRKRLFLRA